MAIVGGRGRSLATACAQRRLRPHGAQPLPLRPARRLRAAASRMARPLHRGGVMLPPEVTSRLRLACTVTRVGLGLTWFLEGLLPKLLHPSPEQVELLARGLPAGLPFEAMLTVLGALQCLFGLWLLTGHAQRLTAGLSTLGVVAATIILTMVSPDAWTHYLGGVVKNLIFAAAGAGVWLLDPLVSLSKQERVT
ncbi:MAG: hypothetical protein EXR52_05895 [Dehalococcoidia bacterium]|nr:hypothetical protein [Dehalococcoidia bacterium]